MINRSIQVPPEVLFSPDGPHDTLGTDTVPQLDLPELDLPEHDPRGTGSR